MKLTSQMLKKIIMEEVSKFGEMETTEDRADDAVEVGADEYGSDKSLEKKLDYMKALKIEENRLRGRISKIIEARMKVARTL